MKRHLSQRKKLIRKKIDKLAHTQSVHRQRRLKNGVKTIALIGYTNTGKSELFKALSGKSTYVQDELFATLHTLSARIYHKDFPYPAPNDPARRPDLIITDTIGFIEELPPKLLNAFRSTLEDTLAADMLLHVIDISDKNFRNKITVVQNILKELGADTLPTLMVFNKIDKLSPEDPLCHPDAQEALSDASSLFISAKTGQNVSLLKKHLFNLFTSSTINPLTSLISETSFSDKYETKQPEVNETDILPENRMTTPAQL